MFLSKEISPHSQLSNPTIGSSYTPITDHSKTARYLSIRYISSRLYIKIFHLTKMHCGVSIWLRGGCITFEN